MCVGLLYSHCKGSIGHTPGFATDCPSHLVHCPERVYQVGAGGAADGLSLSCRTKGWWVLGTPPSLLLSRITWHSFVMDEGRSGRQNFFMEQIAAGKAGAEKMAATRLIRRIQDSISSLLLLRRRREEVSVNAPDPGPASSEQPQSQTLSGGPCFEAISVPPWVVNRGKHCLIGSVTVP